MSPPRLTSLLLVVAPLLPAPPVALGVPTPAARLGSEKAVLCTEKEAVAACDGPDSPQDLLELLVARKYDRSKRPLPCGSPGPTLVEAQLYLMQVNNVDQKLGQVELNGYFRTWWNDVRLAFNGTENGGCRDDITMNGQDAQSIWLPDLYFDNMVEVEVHDGARLVQVSANGDVWRSEQIVITVKSDLQLGRLPYDTHTCIVKLASYSQDTRHIRVTARGGSIGTGTSGIGLKAPAMKHMIWYFPQQTDEKEGFNTPGVVETMDYAYPWDYLSLEFEFARKPIYYINQVLLPSTLFQLICYIQFWVEPTAAPARASLAVIAVLILRTMINSAYGTLPEGAQSMWLLDYLWWGMCLSVGAALEFGVVQFLLILEKRRQVRLSGLLRHRACAAKLCDKAEREGKTLLKVLEECSPVRVAREYFFAEKCDSLPMRDEDSWLAQRSRNRHPANPDEERRRNTICVPKRRFAAAAAAEQQQQRQPLSRNMQPSASAPARTPSPAAGELPGETTAEDADDDTDAPMDAAPTVTPLTPVASRRRQEPSPRPGGEARPQQETSPRTGGETTAEEEDPDASSRQKAVWKTRKKRTTSAAAAAAVATAPAARRKKAEAAAEAGSFESTVNKEPRPEATMTAPSTLQRGASRKELKKAASRAETPRRPAGETTTDEEEGEEPRPEATMTAPSTLQRGASRKDPKKAASRAEAPRRPAAGETTADEETKEVPAVNGNVVVSEPRSQPRSRPPPETHPSTKNGKTVDFNMDISRSVNLYGKGLARELAREKKAKPEAKTAVPEVAPQELPELWQVKRRSPEADQYNVQEADLLFITYAGTVFAQVDRGINQIGPSSLRLALRFFNVYMCTTQAEAVMCMFLRDKQEFTPPDESQASMNFCQFTRLLLEVEEYMLSESIRRPGLRGIVDAWVAMSPSKRVDVSARVMWPMCMISHVIVFYLLLPFY